MDTKKTFLFSIFVISFLFVFLNLGNRAISSDESLTATIAKTITEKGYPSATYDNGQLIITKEGACASVLGKNIYIWNSWMEYYLAALPLSLFGMNEFLLRSPFALLGLLTIMLFYFFAKKLTNNKGVSLISLVVLVTSVPFLLHIRQVRWYSLVMFFSIALLYSYLLILEKRKNSFIYFTFSSILLFHSNFFIFLVLFLGIAVHFVFFFKGENKKEKVSIIKRTVLPLAIIFLLTFPWFYLTQLSKASYMKFNPKIFAINLSLSLYYIFIYMFPFIFLFGIPLLLRKEKARGRKERSIRGSFVFIFVIILTYLLVLSLKTDALPGIRSLIFLTPLFCLITGAIVYKIKEKNKLIAYLLLALLVFTNFLHLFPFIFFKNIALNAAKNFYSEGSLSPEELTPFEKQKFIEDTLKIRFFFVDYLYEITHDYDGSDELIIDYMIKNGNKNDTFAASSFPNTLMLYTGMSMVDLNTTKIDWVIIRGFKIREDIEENFINLVSEKINLSNYDKITINSLEERWADAPDPVNHRFKTNKNGTIILYHLKK